MHAHNMCAHNMHAYNVHDQTSVHTEDRTIPHQTTPHHPTPHHTTPPYHIYQTKPHHRQVCSLTIVPECPSARQMDPQFAQGFHPRLLRYAY